MSDTPQVAPVPVEGSPDSTDFAPPPAPPIRGIPGWLSLVIVTLCLAGGAWLTWTFVMAGGTGGRIIVLDHAPGDGVQPRGNGWTLEAGSTTIHVRNERTGLFGPRRGATEPKYAFEFVVNAGFMTPDQAKVLANTQWLVRDPLVASEIGVTPQQMQILKEVRAGAKVTLDEADERRLRELMPAFVAAHAAETKARAALEAATPSGARGRVGRGGGPRTPAATDDSEKAQEARAALERLQDARRKAELPLIRAAGQIGDKMNARIRQSSSQRAARAKAALSEEQWRKLDSVGK